MPAEPIDYWNHITVDPEVRFGKPCIVGTRITVGDILEKLAYGMTEEDILAEWDYLTSIQIRSCLAYAAEGYLVKVLHPVQPTANT